MSNEVGNGYDELGDLLNAMVDIGLVERHSGDADDDNAGPPTPLLWGEFIKREAGGETVVTTPPYDLGTPEGALLMAEFTDKAWLIISSLLEEAAGGNAQRAAAAAGYFLCCLSAAFYGPAENGDGHGHDNSNGKVGA